MAEDVIKVIRDEMSDMTDTISKSIDALGKAEKHDKALTKEVCDGFKKLTSVIEKFKAIDLLPVVNIASDISKQNKSILDLLGRLVNNDGNGEIVKALTAMTSRSNDLIESALKRPDNSEAIIGLITELKAARESKREVEYFKLVRTQGGIVDRVVIEYKK